MDWFALITTILGQLFAKCYAQQSAEDPQEYLREHYDASTGKMDENLVKDAMPTTRRAIRRQVRRMTPAERRRLPPPASREEIYAMTERKLIEAMNAPRKEITAAFQAAAAMQDDEE